MKKNYSEKLFSTPIGNLPLETFPLYEETFDITNKP